MGAVFRTQPVSMTRQQAIAACREAHIPLLATAMSADAVDLRQADLRAAAVVIGSEGQGICPELFAAAEQKIIIPMSPRCESLNAAVAATIVLWQMKRLGTDDALTRLAVGADDSVRPTVGIGPHNSQTIKNPRKTEGFLCWNTGCG